MFAMVFHFRVVVKYREYVSFNEIRHLKNCKNKLLLYTLFLKLFDDDVLEHSILEQI